MLTWHVLGPTVYILFSKGQSLRKSYNRHKTASCFVVLAVSLPFSPPLSLPLRIQLAACCLVSFVTKWLSLYSYLHFLLPFP